MSVEIQGIEKGSPAGCKHIRPGEKLLSINGNEINDVLDYRFYMVDTRLLLQLADAQGKSRIVVIHKEEYEDPGLIFGTYLIDEKRSCRNHCIFCFIDQLPPGMRESLYFKDDDARLSFLMGNYITLTNLSEHDVQRIIKMHISPINVSVHTTNPELRVKMMGNRFAGESLKILGRLARAGIRMNCQIVLCKGVNDGAELLRTLHDLSELYPAVESIAIVPVGLTKYRGGLFPLAPFTAEDSAQVVAAAEQIGEKLKETWGARLVYPADEFYLRAGRKIPPVAFYESLSQLENGVGMVALLKSQMRDALEDNPVKALREPRRVSLATGTAAFPLIVKLAQNIMKDIAGLTCLVYPIENQFFGKNVNVAGLITGRDLIAQLKERDLGAELLIPESMLRYEGDIFLDDVSVENVQTELHVKVTPVPVNGRALLGAAMGIV